MRAGVLICGAAFAIFIGAAQAQETTAGNSTWALYYFRCLDTHRRHILVTQIGTPTFALDGPTAMPAALKILSRGAAKQTKHACDPKTVYLRGPFTSPQEAQNDYDANLKMMHERHPGLPVINFKIPKGADAVLPPSHKKATSQ
ncbi:MAG TPA: hypothetical protein VK779_02050 [Rhizomicrobium sp.]|jgi:hypothetical protein|nr:hypothetical protein [Rhizomicrobium sp.]